MTTYDERVHKGATLLDSKVPGWQDKIDTDVLDIADETACVLAQLGDGDYFNGAGLAGLDVFDGEETVAYHGFDVTSDNGDDYQEEYAALTAAWLEYLAERNNENGEQ